MTDLKNRISITLYIGDLEVSNQLYLLAKQAGIDSKINIPQEDNKASLQKAHSRIKEIADEMNKSNNEGEDLNSILSKIIKNGNHKK
jgi:flagellar basal body P-ring protein FlgI